MRVWWCAFVNTSAADENRLRERLYDRWNKFIMKADTWYEKSITLCQRNAPNASNHSKFLQWRIQIQLLKPIGILQNWWVWAKTAQNKLNNEFLMELFLLFRLVLAVLDLTLFGKHHAWPGCDGWQHQEIIWKSLFSQLANKKMDKVQQKTWKAFLLLESFTILVFFEIWSLTEDNRN